MYSDTQFQLGSYLLHCMRREAALYLGCASLLEKKMKALSFIIIQAADFEKPLLVLKARDEKDICSKISPFTPP